MNAKQRLSSKIFRKNTWTKLDSSFLLYFYRRQSFCLVSFQHAAASTFSWRWSIYKTVIQSNGKTNSTGNVRFSCFCAHFPCVEMSLTKWGLSTARGASQPFLQTPISEAVTFLEAGHISPREISSLSPILELTKGPSEGPAELLLTSHCRAGPTNTGMGTCQMPPTSNKWHLGIHRFLGQEGFGDASRPNDLTLLPLLMYTWHIDHSEHVLQNSYVLVGSQACRIGRS